MTEHLHASVQQIERGHKIGESGGCELGCHGDPIDCRWGADSSFIILSQPKIGQKDYLKGVSFQKTQVFQDPAG